MAATHIHPVARVYAQALLDLAASRVDAVGSALEAVLGSWRTDAELLGFFTTPAITPEAKKRALESLRGKVDDLILDFLGVVVENERFPELEAMLAAYRDLADEAAGRVRVQVRSAHPLHDDERRRIGEIVASKLQKKGILELEVDPQLVSGFVIQAGDTVWEASLHGALRRLHKEMMRSSGFHEN